MIIEINFLFKEKSLVVIRGVKELDLRKERLYINKSNEVQKVMNVHNQLKSSSNYVKTSLGYSEIDYYDSCDSFDIPYFKISKGERKIKIGTYSSNDIPKAWQSELTIVLNTKTMPLILKAISTLGYNLSDKELKLIKNKFTLAKKDKTNEFIELEQEEKEQGYYYY